MTRHLETNSSGIHVPAIKQSTLSNGARVVSEYHPNSHAVCIGVFVNIGTRDEPAGLEGASHFVEHMVFKGTETRDSYEISRTLEAVGGDLNAYTSREETCFHATCLKDHLPLAVDLLADLLSNAEFDLNDFKKERDVILQEIRMSNDDVDELVYDIFFKHSFKGSNLSKNILGTNKSLAAITRKKLYEYYQSRYFGSNVVVSVVGHVNHEDICELLERKLVMRRKTKPIKAHRRKPAIHPFVKVESRKLEQVHVLMGVPSASSKDRARFESYILNTALGGGMTSRLFQKIREKQGLSYTVYSTTYPFIDTGLMITYAATSKKNVMKVVKAIANEMKIIKARGLKKSELEAYKTQVIGEILLDADNIENRMQSLGGNMLFHGVPRTVDDVVKDVRAISVDSMRNYLDTFFDLDKLGVIVMGDVAVDKTKAAIEKVIGR